MTDDAISAEDLPTRLTLDELGLPDELVERIVVAEDDVDAACVKLVGVAIRLADGPRTPSSRMVGELRLVVRSYRAACARQAVVAGELAAFLDRSSPLDPAAVSVLSPPSSASPDVIGPATG
jgi:hypothetical protein